MTSNSTKEYNYDPIVKKLTISRAALFTKNILNTFKDTEILDISNCNLKELPNKVQLLKNLKVIFFSYNNFEEFPKILSKCKSLEGIGCKSSNIKLIPENSLPESLKWLTLTDNKIDKLPSSIGKLKNLKKLLLAGNNFKEFPNEILSCQSLELFRFSANSIEKSPDNLALVFPNLAWFADSGNLYKSNLIKQKERSKVFNWNDFEIKEKIGESAQNEIYKATLIERNEDVAIKIFGGEVTSDGNPEDDINISIAAGNHPNLIGAYGRVINNPDNKNCLALPLIKDNYKKLALPPSLKTCTRDTFTRDTKLKLERIINILKGISSACVYLHSKGIMHGDIYAHNILVNDEGHAYLGDFGAASFYNREEENWREIIDIRAFGYLIEDLMNVCEDNFSKEYFQLIKLKNTLMNQKDLVINFSEIEKKLSIL